MGKKNETIKQEKLRLRDDNVSIREVSRMMINVSEMFGALTAQSPLGFGNSKQELSRM
ncbi:hypothetical protein DPMN_148573 [Dreissena polymorpha]|uniref:Uncharacterized protein n=1 Tax=Dreissena polymorpha TaxID=45954 RepID=A0A9D4FCR0_DREPO|nr:hypothetical protein DPMN_148573 [Dreissena polymorpha]